MRLIYAVFILLLAMMTSAQCQQTAKEWISRGHALASAEYIDIEGKTEAIKAFDKAIDLDPTNKEAWLGLGDALRGIAAWTNNEEDLRQAANVYAVYGCGTNLSNPRSAPALSDHANRTALNKSNTEPQTAAEWIAFGNTTFFSRNRLEQALAAYNRAIELDPNSTIAWIARGKLFDSIGPKDVNNYAEAVKSFDKAIDINPESLAAWSQLEETLSDMYAYEEASHVQKLVGNYLKVDLSDPKNAAALSDHMNRTKYGTEYLEKQAQSLPEITGTVYYGPNAHAQ